VAIRIAEALAILLAGTGLLLLVFARIRRTKTVDEVPSPPLEGRRVFLNRVMFGSLAIFAVAFGGASIAWLWPGAPRRGTYGTKIVAGKLNDLLDQIKLYKLPIYNVAGRFYLVKYETSDPKNLYVQAGVVAGGLMALSQKCSHLGCRVPFCATSQFFECPCHDARFNMAGEVRNGPAPAGLWRFKIEITNDGSVVVDTSTRLAQPPRGTDTTGQQQAGAFCVTD
jgi:cytochrome b6-f complex iron-sulfur subunit